MMPRAAARRATTTHESGVPVPYGIKEQVQSVEEVLPNLADRDWVFWKTSYRIFRSGLSNTGFVAPAALPAAA
jgi:hypothetical protein